MKSQGHRTGATFGPRQFASPGFPRYPYIDQNGGLTIGCTVLRLPRPGFEPESTDLYVGVPTNSPRRHESVNSSLHNRDYLMPPYTIIILCIGFFSSIPDNPFTLLYLHSSVSLFPSLLPFLILPTSISSVTGGF